METYHLCDSEYRFMQVVWAAAPIGSGALTALCADRLGWKKSTTYTVLKKMCQKGLLKNEDSLVTVVTPREVVAAQAAEGFVERTFGGSLPGFLTAFMGGRRLTAAGPSGEAAGAADFSRLLVEPGGVAVLGALLPGHGDAL